MGKFEGMRIWKTGAESAVVSGQERNMNISDFVEKSRVQATNYAKMHEKQVSAFIGAGHRDTVLNAVDRLSAAKMIVRNEPYIIPDTIDGLDHQAAFIIALAEELQKPEYNQ